jgi:hypothetical protein
MTLAALMRYVDAHGYLRSAAVTSDVTMNPSNWLDSCTNPITTGDPMCQPALGETQTSCCQDCGCDSFGDDYICTSGGCQPKSVVTLSISPGSIRTDCTLLPDSVEFDDDDHTGEITKYLCSFRNPIEIEAHVDNIPVSASGPVELYYYLDGDKNKKIQDQISESEKTSTGWKFKMLPKTLESTSRNVRTSHTLRLGFTLVASDQGNEIVIPLESGNEIPLTYNVKESDDLISVERNLEKYEEQMEKYNQYLGYVSFVIGFCGSCFVSAVGKWLEMGSAAEAVFFDYVVAFFIEVGVYAGIYVLTEGLGGSKAWYIGGVIAGKLFWAIGCPSNPKCGTLCPKIIPLCKVTTVVALLALMMLANKMESVGSELKSDIENDIALAKADLYDDLSFYYQ